MEKIYPIITIARNENANRFFAVPIIGLLVKLIILIPVFIFTWLVALVAGILTCFVNPFFVLFTGRYWNKAYFWTAAYLIYTTKIFFFISGLTDKYPGFNFDTQGSFTMVIPTPQNPHRLFAIPVLGLLARFILLIPYLIYAQILQTGAYVGAFLSFAEVLFKGKYPESTYEFGRDTQRVAMGMSVYLFGLSDSYPSFWISMNHKRIKIALIIAGVILTILQYTHRSNNQYRYSPLQPSNYTSQSSSSY